MKRLKNFFKKHRVLAIVIIIVVILLIIIGIPIIINSLFKISTPIKFFAAEWDAGSFLGYYGTVLTFLSTTLLSILALWQNHIIKENNEKHTALLDRMEREKNAPYFAIEIVSHLGKSSNIYFELKNISQNIAYDIKVFDLEIKYNRDEISKKEQICSKNYLNPLESIYIQLDNHAIDTSEPSIQFNVKCTDKFGEVHTFKVVGCFVENNISTFNITEEKHKGESNNVYKT